VRATTAFNKMLAIPGAHVTGVVFTPDGIVVDLGRRAKRLRCPCGWSTRAVYDRSRRSWRSLDLAASKVFLRAEIRRLSCRRCGRVVTEEVPWARPGARFTRDFEDVVTWLAQRMDKTAITRLLRCSWEAVAHIVTRVVADQLDRGRLEDVYRIGVDEVSYRKGHRYLTVVADHDRDGVVIWAGEGKSAATLEQFYDTLGEDGCTQRSRRPPTPRRPKPDSASTRSTSSLWPTRPSTRPAAGPGTSNGTRPARPPRSTDANPAAGHQPAAAHHRDGTRPAGSSTPAGRC